MEHFHRLRDFMTGRHENGRGDFFTLTQDMTPDCFVIKAQFNGSFDWKMEQSAVLDLTASALQTAASFKAGFGAQRRRLKAPALQCDWYWWLVCVWWLVESNQTALGVPMQRLQTNESLTILTYQQPSFIFHKWGINYCPQKTIVCTV